MSAYASINSSIGGLIIYGINYRGTYIDGRGLSSAWQYLTEASLREALVEAIVAGDGIHLAH